MDSMALFAPLTFIALIIHMGLNDIARAIRETIPEDDEEEKDPT